MPPNDERCAQVVSIMSQKKEAILWMIEAVISSGSEHRIVAKARQQFPSTSTQRNPMAKPEKARQ